MRIAFTLIGGKAWTGGHNYLLNLLKALLQYQTHTVVPILFVGEDASADIPAFQALEGLEVVRTHYLNASSRASSLAQALLWGRCEGLSRVFKEHGIELVFEAAQFFGWRLPIPALAWIPDFQHKVLPHLFSKSAWWKREIGFRAQIWSGRSIMLSSEDARQACERYYPSTLGRTSMVHFAVPYGVSGTHAAARRVADAYRLPTDFIFMPNQFWRHKNHDLVLEALAILKKRGTQVVIAASGNQHDPRAPDYFPSLLKKVEHYRLQDSFRLLGLIPYEHLSALMRVCTYMLNPSLFEGWSTTVEEARALEVPMILSDLDVHREQMQDAAVYFCRHSPLALADVLEASISSPAVARDQDVNRAQALAEQRVSKFAADFAVEAERCHRMYHNK